MPSKPTWEDVKAAAAAMTNCDDKIYGVCLRSKAGWGKNMAFLSAISNSYGAKWFDMDWTPQFDGAAWKETLANYLDMMTNYGPPGMLNNGFNKNLALFQQGHCGMWIDATVAASSSFVTNPNDSTITDRVGFALASNRTGKMLGVRVGVFVGVSDNNRLQEWVSKMLGVCDGMQLHHLCPNC